MEPNCALKATRQLFKNKGCYHHKANDRFGLIVQGSHVCTITFLGKATFVEQNPVILPPSPNLAFATTNQKPAPLIRDIYHL